MEGSGRKQAGRKGRAVLSPYTNYTSSQQRPPSTMTDPALQIPEVIQSSTVRRNPSPEHDLNPATTASEKQPVVAGPASDAGSISSDIVDSSRMIRPVRRRQTLPPMPDLRFEQSYLASIKDADTWGRVAWITIRDQVRLPSITAMRQIDQLSRKDSVELTSILSLLDRSCYLSSKAQSGP